MPSFIMHIAAAKVYLKKHPEENVDEFYRGSIAPDLVKDKSKSHYSAPVDENKNVATILHEKVNLRTYVKNHKIDNSFERGYFLHLITDYEFYSNYFSEEILSTFQNIDQFDQAIYHDYNSLTNFLKNTYNVTLPDSLKRFDYDNNESLKITSEEKVCRLIDSAADIDLDKEYLKLSDH